MPSIAKEREGRADGFLLQWAWSTKTHPVWRDLGL